MSCKTSLKKVVWLHSWFLKTQRWEAPMGSIEEMFPVEARPYDFSSVRSGLVLVDLVNGFATPGAGALAPPDGDKSYERVKALAAQWARTFAEASRPVLAFQDSHPPGQIEPPYPVHCEAGSGEDDLIEELRWLETEPQATLIRKDCINGFIGAIDPDTQKNRVVDWVVDNNLDAVICLGICTDICVMDFVLTLLSARNHGLLGRLRDVVVFAPACTTYDLPHSYVAANADLPATACHPQAESHHMGMYFMASRGAIMASDLVHS
jgi:nicotinamidase-related amidase